MVGTKFSLLDVFAATTGRHIVFLLVSRSAFWVAFCVFVEATILISAHRSPIFPLRNKNGRGYTLRTVIRYDDKTSSRYACPEALAVGIVGIELDRHAHLPDPPSPTRPLAHSLRPSFVRQHMFRREPLRFLRLHVDHGAFRADGRQGVARGHDDDGRRGSDGARAPSVSDAVEQVRDTKNE